MPKRKRSQPSIPSASAPAPAPAAAVVTNGTPSRRLSRNASSKVITYQEDGSDSEVLDAEEALLASPSAEGPIALVPEEDEFVDEKEEEEEEGSDEADMDTKKKGKAGKGKGSKTKSPVAKKPALVKAVKTSKPKAAVSKKVKGEEDEDDFMPGDEADEEGEVVRPPAVNDDYVPLPWKGRLGYVRSPLPHIHDLTDPLTSIHLTRPV